MFIRKNWKSLWIVKSETTVDVPECNGCILPEHPALLSTHCVSGSPPEPDGFPEQQQQIPLLPVLPAQQCPALLCSALPPSLHVPLQPPSAASAAQMLLTEPACLPWEQLGGSCHLPASSAVTGIPFLHIPKPLQLPPAPLTVAVAEPVLGTAVLPPEAQHGEGLPLPQVTLPRIAACTNWTAHTD